MDTTGKQLIEILREELFSQERGKAVSGLSSDALFGVLSLAKKHDLAHIVAGAAIRAGVFSGEILSRMEKEYQTALFRHARFNRETARIFAALEEAEIDFMPLKGVITRELYPESWMRMSTDIDVMVREEDVARAKAVLSEKLGYTETASYVYEVTFATPLQIEVELHFAFSAQDTYKFVDGKLTERMWENALLCEGTRHRYELTPEFFYALHMVHGARHLTGAGVGIRFVIDTLIIRNQLKMDDARRAAFIEEFQLKKFEEETLALCGYWFLGKDASALTEQYSDYAIESGVHGKIENFIATRRKKYKNRFTFILGRMFLSYKELCNFYPVLRKHKILYPVCVIRRWFDLLRRSGEDVVRFQINNFYDASEGEEDRIDRFLQDLDLKVPEKSDKKKAEKKGKKNRKKE